MSRAEPGRRTETTSEPGPHRLRVLRDLGNLLYDYTVLGPDFAGRPVQPCCGRYHISDADRILSLASLTSVLLQKVCETPEGTDFKLYQTLFAKYLLILDEINEAVLEEAVRQMNEKKENG